jgi:4a-hydroxytetrahydrobiopterin dehydratase
MELHERNCVPCKGGIPPMSPDEVAKLLANVEGWGAPRDRRLMKTFKFPDFKAALAFVDRVGAMAEQQNHHPDLQLAWGKVVVEVWTHKIDGLTESDFVFAAKCDQLAKPAPT